MKVIEGADHSFNLPGSLGREAVAVWDEIVETCTQWLEAMQCPPKREE